VQPVAVQSQNKKPKELEFSQRNSEMFCIFAKIVKMKFSRQWKQTLENLLES
jgi:hypothetical protein